jgi:hypothetical protein
LKVAPLKPGVVAIASKVIAAVRSNCVQATSTTEKYILYTVPANAPSVGAAASRDLSLVHCMFALLFDKRGGQQTHRYDKHRFLPLQRMYYKNDLHGAPCGGNWGATIIVKNDPLGIVKPTTASINAKMFQVYTHKGDKGFTIRGQKGVNPTLTLERGMKYTFKLVTPGQFFQLTKSGWGPGKVQYNKGVRRSSAYKPYYLRKFLKTKRVLKSVAAKVALAATATKRRLLKVAPVQRKMMYPPRTYGRSTLTFTVPMDAPNSMYYR